MKKLSSFRILKTQKLSAKDMESFRGGIVAGAGAVGAMIAVGVPTGAKAGAIIGAKDIVIGAGVVLYISVYVTYDWAKNFFRNG